MKAFVFTRKMFPHNAGLNGTLWLRFTQAALVRAVVAAGANPARRRGTKTSKFDIAMRVNALKSALDMSGPFLRPTHHFMHEGVTDKGTKSFFVGNAICAHAAESAFNIPWLVDIENMGAKYQVMPHLTGKRPDYLGRTPGGNWHVFESKGRSSKPNRSAINEWKVQARSVRRVNGKQVTYNIVSAAFLNKDECWELIWIDPPPDEKGPEVTFDEDLFFSAYYGKIYEFIQKHKSLGIPSQYGLLVPIGDAGVSLGLHHQVEQAFLNKDWESVIHFAQSQSTGDDAVKLEASIDTGISIFPDGLLIQFNSDWGGETKLSSPVSPKSVLVKPSTKISAMGTQTTSIGQIEHQTQQRVVKLFRETLGYAYLGDWEERAGNRNIETERLRAFLKNKQGCDDGLITKAIHLLERAAGDTSKSLYDRNQEVYGLLRYGVKVKPDAGENTVTVHLIDWKHPEYNDFAIAEEVSVLAADVKAHPKRPDVVIYVNGLALGVLELKRSTVSVAEGIRQNLDNQKKEFIQPFFSTVQLLLAGNDAEGLHYGSIETKEKYYLTWKESDPKLATGDLGLLDSALIQLCSKARLLEFIHDFIVFDAGIKKLCRHNQYFAVRASQDFIGRREGGIIWNTQGSGKSLIMVWLAKWIRENVTNSRVLIITDRTELDEQIEKIFLGVKEDIYRTQSGADLIARLNATKPWLLCSLIHKFGGKEDGQEVGDIKAYVEEVKKALPKGFVAKGDLYVFVDECHRTQSGDLHQAMKAILPNAVFIGFTGTPLLKSDKKKSIEIFGRYIHTYKFDEAVADGVVLDLRYEARDIDQNIVSQDKIDTWFEAKTKGLTDLAKAQLKQRWGTMQKVMSSQSRLEKIVADILMDMETRDRLKSGRGNALLVSDSIYQACKLYELFDKTDLHGKCAIVTSYSPTAASIKGEESGEGLTERLRQYAIYKKMLADWFNEPEEIAVTKIEEFELAAKKKFIEQPSQLKLVIVVDKLLTGFDAPPATYLYIDKQMQDHGLFQAICRVNRLDGDDKDYGYIVDYKDLFKSLEGAVQDYTSGAFDAYDKEDVAGLLENRLVKGREDLEAALESVRALCEPVEAPRDDAAFYRYFSSNDHGNAEQLKANEPKRLSLYKLTAALVRAYANVAGEMIEAGYSETEAVKIKTEVVFYENLRSQVKLHSGDAIDLKQYEPAMRHLIDAYIRAEESEPVSKLNDLSLIQLIVERGADAVKSLPKSIRQNETAVAETIENNVRKLIIDEQPINPKYYERMSQLLDALILQRKQQAIDYKKYLEKIIELTKLAKNPNAGGKYPKTLNTTALRALYDNLGKDEPLAVAVNDAVNDSAEANWRDNTFKVKKVRYAIKRVLKNDDELTDQVLNLVKKQNDY